MTKLRSMFRDSHVFRSMFFSYLIILILPILFSPLILYGAGDAISAQLKTANETSLSLLQNAVDSQIQDIYMRTAAILVSDPVRRMRYASSIDVSAYMDDLQIVQTEMQRGESHVSLVSQMYVYFSESGDMLTKNILYTADHLSSVLPVQMHCSEVQFKEWIYTGERRKYVLVGSSEHPEEQMLFLFHRLYPTLLSTGQVTMITKLDLTQLRAMMEQYGASETALFHIEGEDGGQVTTIHAHPNVHASIFDRLVYHQIDEIRIPSTTTSFTYVLTPSLETLIQKSHMHVYFIGYYSLCLVLGVFLIVRFSNTHYTPLQNLVSTLRINIQKNTKSDEYALIEQELNDMLERIENGDQAVQVSREFYRSNFLHELARGRVTGQLDERLHTLGLPAADSTFLLVVYSINHINFSVKDTADDEATMQLIDQVIHKVIQDIGESSLRDYVFSIDDVIACLVEAPNPQGPDFEETVEKVQRKIVTYLADHVGVTTIAAISSPYTGIAHLQDAYDETRKGIRRMAVLGIDRQVVRCAQLPNADTRLSSVTSLSSIIQLEQKLLTDMRSEHYQQALERMQQILQVDEQDHRDTRDLEMYLMQLMMIYHQALQESPTWKRFPVETQDHWKEQIMRCNDVNSFEVVLSDLTKELIANQKVELPSMSPRDARILQYMQDNYTNPDLNINAVSSYFDLSPSYLSKIVKDCVGQNALDYLHSIRIRAAKELMSTTNLSIQDIAEKVGYGNKLNIIRAFKRYEGISPTMYRDAIREGAQKP